MSALLPLKLKAGQEVTRMIWELQKDVTVRAVAEAAVRYILPVPFALLQFLLQVVQLDCNMQVTRYVTLPCCRGAVLTEAPLLLIQFVSQPILLLTVSPLLPCR